MKFIFETCVIVGYKTIFIKIYFIILSLLKYIYKENILDNLSLNWITNLQYLDL